MRGCISTRAPVTTGEPAISAAATGLIVISETAEQAHLRRLRATVERWERITAHKRVRRMTVQLRHALTMLDQARAALAAEASRSCAPIIDAPRRQTHGGATRPTGTVYLLHFDRPYAHAKHYIGFTDDLTERLIQHQTGRGARLIEVIIGAGNGFTLARTWLVISRAMGGGTSVPLTLDGTT
jgi:hypothetical protein